MQYRRIGILTSGGDAPGMNAAIRAITCVALAQGVEVMGIYDGYAGLLGGEMKLFCERDVADAESRGGTLLYSARCDAFRAASGVAQGVAMCRQNQIDGLVVIGGDGTLRGAAALCAAGVPCVGIPASIDNDIVATEQCIGFDSAVNTAIRMIDCLKDTSESHARCSLCEVMGRGCGEIALATGIAVGAIGIAIPEFPFDTQALLARLVQTRRAGKRELLVVVAEGVREGNTRFSDSLAATIAAQGIETRTTVLGHVVRGGAPSAADRLLGARMGRYAVELLLAGKQNLVVGIRQGSLCITDMETAQTWDRAYRACLPLLCEGVGEAHQVRARILRTKQAYRLGELLARA